MVRVEAAYIDCPWEARDLHSSRLSALLLVTENNCVLGIVPEEFWDDIGMSP